MELSKLVQTGITNKPPRIVVHGVHGIGKSIFGSKAPSPIFLQTEDGLSTIDVPRFPVATTVEEVWHNIRLLIKEEHEYKTLVVDTADWLQTIFWNEVCRKYKVKNIEDIGYGKGYIAAMESWEKFFTGVEKLRNEKGMAIVILAHSEIKSFNPPDGESYDRYQIKLHKTSAAKLEEWADAVLFANFKVYVDDDTHKATNNEPQRVLFSSNRPAWRAKTRYAAMPGEMIMDFNVMLKSIKDSFAPKTTNKEI